MIVLSPEKTLADVLKAIPDGIKCGQHSNIPDCCIAYYVRVHVWRSPMELTYWHETNNVLLRKFKHIPCPECLRAKRIIKLKKCNCGKADAPQQTP